MRVPKQQRAAYFKWREWILGEGAYAGRGSRSDPRPRIGFGGVGQQPVPKTWWKDLEEFLARRDNKEKTVAPPWSERVKGPGRRRTPADPLQLSKNFHVREFDCKNGARVPEVALPALRRLVTEILQPMRDTFGPALVVSGYRPWYYNLRIGGARWSQHIYELTPESVAADVIFSKGNATAWYLYADTLMRNLGYGGVGHYPRSGFVHVDNRSHLARWSG